MAPTAPLGYANYVEFEVINFDAQTTTVSLKLQAHHAWASFTGAIAPRMAIRNLRIAASIKQSFRVNVFFCNHTTLKCTYLYINFRISLISRE